MTIKQLLMSYINNNPGKTTGLIAGLIFGILIPIIGFWYTVLLGICALLGIWIGSFHDKKENFLMFLDKILPNILNK